MTNDSAARLLADAEVWLAHMIADLQQEHGLSSLLILAAAHGIITAMMLEELGPEQTAIRLPWAVSREEVVSGRGRDIDELDEERARDAARNTGGNQE